MMLVVAVFWVKSLDDKQQRQNQLIQEQKQFNKDMKDPVKRQKILEKLRKNY
jgi:hypothetical protein